MILLACIEAVALVAVVIYLTRQHAEQAAAWYVERRELLNRIQRPEHVPVAGSLVPFEWPEDQPDEIELVGTIRDPEPDES